ncbi:BMT2 [Candida oxycetoniae]|uniref:25S rRNA adenine-N(1) methyltransferase n=1 Tax=Candida oxycetoniae TaxID=497107 RepID=A0AAI9WZC2_9ASCO|nr:BMT2 [Candida oxycetoniae]KAI3405755.2 BMT2 [Candida oxycetoniae]
MTGKRKRGGGLGLLHHAKTITGNNGGGLRTGKSLKPQQTRQIIRRFHQLQKNKHAILTRLRQFYDISGCKYEVIKQDKLYRESFNSFKIPAKYCDNEIYKIDSTLSRSDLVEILAKIDSEIEQRGGIEKYQTASAQGQTSKRGGDSSKKLIEWLRTEKYAFKIGNDVTALEIGCLSPRNAISTSGIFTSVIKIDLNSQDPLILQQDFMKRPLPKNKTEKFNLISCSLVLNFVPSHEERGKMLKRITKFLKEPKDDNSIMSSLFLVLPLPCVSNSRYFDNTQLLKIMESIGFEQTFYHEAKKVAYWLFDWNGKLKRARFSKRELHSRSNGNNFCITI